MDDSTKEDPTKEELINMCWSILMAKDSNHTAAFSQHIISIDKAVKDERQLKNLRNIVTGPSQIPSPEQVREMAEKGMIDELGRLKKGLIIVNFKKPRNRNGDQRMPG